MQRSGEIMPAVHNSVDTVNAAIAAIVTAESRRTRPGWLRRNWVHRLSVYFCFGSQSNNGRGINQAARLPEHVPQGTAEIPNQPFVAPPSSPASLLQSEPTSTVDSPSIGTPPFSPLLPNSSSPTESISSIFAVGPYAYETQLVSPPVFSGSTTDSSTPRFTPPDSVQATSPSSPEIPYANFLTLINNSENGETCEIELYPNYPDSPIGRQISPSSGYSGHKGNASSLLDRHITSALPVADFSARLQHNDHAMDRQVSFELTVEDVARCLEKKPAVSRDYATSSFRFAPISSDDHKREFNGTRAGLYANETCHVLPETVRQSLSRRLPKEFKFDNVDAHTTGEPSVRSDWWANEKVAGLTVEPKKI